MKIIFGGDIFLVNSSFKLSKDIRSILNECELRVCNFEAPIADPIIDFEIIKAGPSLFQTSIAAESAVLNGFNLFSLANNHILDYGESGLKKTMKVFDDLDVRYFGAGLSYEDVYNPFFYESNNERIAIIALSQAEFGVFKPGSKIGYAWINHPNVNKIIVDIKKKVDKLLIYAHAGLENIKYPLPEWQNRYRELIDLGADCIIATHAHIVQGFEVYNDKYIFYSLGNLYFNREKYDSSEAELEWSRSLMILIDTDSFDKIKIIPVSVKEKTIYLDESISFANDLQERSKVIQNNVKLINEIDKVAEDLWTEYYEDYYSWGRIDFGKINTLKLLKHIIKRYILPKKNKSKILVDKTMLLHNIQIETHRWVVERHLFNLNRKYNKL